MHHRCGGCPRLWTGLAECHCAACHRHFGGITAFDIHRSGGQCREPARLKDEDGQLRLLPVDRASGLVWVTPVRYGQSESLEPDEGMNG